MSSWWAVADAVLLGTVLAGFLAVALASRSASDGS